MIFSPFAAIFNSAYAFITNLYYVCYVYFRRPDTQNKTQALFDFHELDIIYIVRQICLGRSLFYYAFFWCGFLCNALCVGAFFNNCRLEFDNIFFQVFALVGAI